MTAHPRSDRLDRWSPLIRNGLTWLIEQAPPPGDQATTVNDTESYRLSRSGQITLGLIMALLAFLLYRQRFAANQQLSKRFGHARSVTDTRARHCLCGSVDYAPPEAWRPGLMGAASDVWAWGRSWHLLATGQYFERIENFQQLLRAGRSPLPPVAQVSRSPLPPSLATLIDAALDPNPRGRPADGKEVHERLQLIAREEWRDVLGSLSRFVWSPLEGVK